MTESNWKVVVDRGRLTISSDAFTFTTSGTDPMHLEAVVADLQSAVRETYGQYCGLSRAAEMVGERWGFLIVRDLLTGPKSAADLHTGLPLMSVKLVTRRLKELTYSGVVQPLDDDVDSDHVRYELTEYGRALEDAVLAFGRWGAATLATPRPEDIVTDASLLVALKATFLPEAARGVRVSYELRINDHVLNARIDDGVLDVAPGPLPGADAVLDLGFVLLALMTGEMTADDVLATGQARVEGDPALLHRFVEMFQLPELPAPKVPA
ncbi:winged helix-turn-helix transcriptional regulator [Actinophytocola sp. NPDC049390]|uniref:winged helix-turn-helix transcriptional regulator n=1 Tax=Actinophytocola sp. NPDC049390 TaxID=3363894 RepID=UPI0037BAD2E7